MKMTRREAVATGHAAVATDLLRTGADVNALDEMDHPMLAVAALHGHGGR
ncbi:hypothetical protein SDRG_15376 [Saprolegnia diclina VS20]|uniref:Uncharacterized protein n=1 Tax=Saprolegnia diclina (strain VS20) TaxID=1156394 RepID=T0RB56_SAPDV|nr:hypothetical protein SDRG_15376 [Saprolegnia diclina VS20]EQC26787.1 hypothetical protein SDRG_15376 [Saprolegnia diclina VS20]|eukprot:XP_008619769.1 hypothetical protein SDRG_15376 [Saprolegnia diclina VS20]